MATRTVTYYDSSYCALRIGRPLSLWVCHCPSYCVFIWLVRRCSSDEEV